MADQPKPWLRSHRDDTPPPDRSLRAVAVSRRRSARDRQSQSTLDTRTPPPFCVAVHWISSGGGHLRHELVEVEVVAPGGDLAVLHFERSHHRKLDRLRWQVEDVDAFG